ncbi:MAG: PEGA domain-containing protein [Candidatus Sulfotelmatobacter sp.]
MSFARVFTVCLATLLSVGVVAAENPAYEKGTLTIGTASGHKFYNLSAGLKVYQIGNCGDFQDGQEVKFLLKEDKIYIAHEGAKDYKCSIQATTESLNANSPATPNDLSGPSYLKGTVLGYSVRRDIHVSGGGSPGGTGFPIGSSTRKARVYEVQGPDLIYEADYCGAFQAGEFSPGQVVEFRVDSGGGRFYIRHDGNKEYNCQLEGTRKPDAPPAEAAAATSVVPTSAAAPSTARLSIVSVPEGADIEIDGNFAGNTPSDLEVPEGGRSIVVKKPGYKNWERKMMVVAGSSVHLNAELEKSTNP